MLKKYKEFQQMSQNEMKNLRGGQMGDPVKGCVPDGQPCDCVRLCCSSGNSCGLVPHICGSGGPGTDI